MRGLTERTIQSLTEITDFPFYTATYYADYGLNQFTDSIRSISDIPPFFAALFRRLGHPTLTSLHGTQSDPIGCSSFVASSPEGSRIVGKNLDWRKGPVLLLRAVPEDGYHSLSLVDLSLCDLFGLHDTKYALLTAPYVPFDGMNNQGLTVSMLSLQCASDYPNSPGKSLVGDFNMIRIILDRCGTIDEAVETFSKYNVVQSGPLPIHYLITDPHGSCLIELSNGEVRALQREGHTCVTNFSQVSKPALEAEARQCARFQTMEHELESTSGVLSVRAAKQLLSRVAVYQPEYSTPSTIWSIVFEPDCLRMRIRIGNDGPYYRVGLGREP